MQYSTSEILDLVFGGDYCLQLRAQPDGKKFKGGWSAWSEAVCIQVPPGTGKGDLQKQMYEWIQEDGASCAEGVIAYGFHK